MKVAKVNDSSATAVTGRCKYWGILVGTDGTNDPTISVYDNTSAAGTELVPTCEFDASAKGYNGVMLNQGVDCSNGIHVAITLAAGNVEIIVYYD